MMNLPARMTNSLPFSPGRYKGKKGRRFRLRNMKAEDTQESILNLNPYLNIEYWMLCIVPLSAKILLS